MKYLLLTIVLLSMTGVKAQNLDSGPLEQIDIYLHTVETGDMVYDNFGHTAIRVHNKNNDIDAVFNWGIFDFSSPVEFSLNFYKGILNYRLGVDSFDRTLRHYQLQKRTVWEDKLNLSPEAKKILLQRLMWNMQEENIEYQYQYFFNNCSTKVRDYFDEALAGAFKAEFEKQMTGRTFRNTVRTGYATNPEIQLPLDVIMNGDIDAEMNKWQEMFLPLYLREYLLELSVDGSKVVSESKVLFEFAKPKPYYLSSFQMLAIFLIIVSAGIFYGQTKIQGFTIERWLFLLCWPVLLVLGIFGLVMPLNWMFSNHTDLHHNANMLLLWPIDLILLWPLTMIIIKGRNYFPKSGLGKFLDKYIFTHIAFNILFFLMWLVGIFSQNVSNTALYLMPCLTILMILIKRAYSSAEPVLDRSITTMID